MRWVVVDTSALNPFLLSDLAISQQLKKVEPYLFLCHFTNSTATLPHISL
jgi:hypothetical protein